MKLETGKYQRPCFGEIVNGDSIIIKELEQYLLLSVIDGLGHGKVAADISDQVAQYLFDHWQPDTKNILESVHKYMQGSKGAVIGIGIIEKSKMELQYSGLGNIVCKVYGDENISLLSANGLLGIRSRSLSNKVLELKKTNMIMMCSDGISENIKLDLLPHYSTVPASLYAKMIVQKFGNPYDDASCLIVKIKDD
jgi:serine/threonine protein phosphatase PrpC